MAVILTEIEAVGGDLGVEKEFILRASGSTIHVRLPGHTPNAGRVRRVRRVSATTAPAIAPEQSPRVIALRKADRTADRSCGHSPIPYNATLADRGQIVHPIRVQFLSAQSFDPTTMRRQSYARPVNAVSYVIYP